MPQHAQIMSRHDKTVKKKRFWIHAIACPNHAAAWRRYAAFLFLETRFRTPIVILLCSYKKEVIGIIWRHLVIYFLLNLSRLLREFVRKSLGTWRQSIEDLFHQFNLALYFISPSSISFYLMISNTSMMNFIKNMSY